MTRPTDDDHDTHEDYERRLALAEEQACNYQGVHHLVPVPMHEGLVQCLICHGWEGSLATECPGRKMTYNEGEAVFGGMIDFRNGQWVRLKEGPLLEDCLSSGG